MARVRLDGQLSYRLARAAMVGVVLLGAAVGGCGKDEPTAEQGVAFEYEREYEQGALQVVVAVDRTSIGIAETVRLRIETMVAAGYQLEMAEVGEELAEHTFGVLEEDAGTERLVEGGGVARRFEYGLEPVIAGVHDIPGLRLAAVPIEAGGDRAAGEVVTEPITIEVVNPLDAEGAEGEIADIKDVVELGWDRRFWLWAGAIAIVVVVMLVVGAVWLIGWRNRREKPRVYRTAHELAHESLERLMAERLAEDGQVKLHYERISAILRRYIEHRFGVRAPERTTEEFLLQAREVGEFTPRQREMLQEFLEHCDLVKFARYAPTGEQVKQTYDLTWKFIDATRSVEAVVDVTDGSGAYFVPASASRGAG